MFLFKNNHKVEESSEIECVQNWDQDQDKIIFGLRGYKTFFFFYLFIHICFLL